MSVLKAIKVYAEHTDRALLTCLDDVTPETLRAACLHYPAAGGKRLRPVMALLACEAAGGERARATPLAVALELIHNFSLIHDDIMDRDDLRRGIPTVHRKWDEATAILAGDTLFAKAFELLAAGGADPEVTRRVVLDVAVMGRVLCEGQVLDMAGEREDVTKDRYLDMIDRKTARIFEVAARSGGLLGGATASQADALGTYGRDFGLAFQIHDDVLDLVSTTEVLGKPAGSDIRAGKKTLVAVLAHARADAKQRATLAQGFGKIDATEAEVAAVLDVFRATRALADAEAEVARHTERAIRALEALPPGSSRDLLADLARWGATRTS
ncbi:MAG TPA: polyprenyl synthetase family protein [Candidatus Thermoplasmatota archaeon]|nr:polyprenyl synthetase family protein [Candidatus Thermoplasmatota archaeon]